MKKLIVTLLSFLLYTNIIFSQNSTVDFSILTPNKSVVHSLYKHLTVIDSRTDTVLGIIQTGSSNKQTKVIAKTPLAYQLNKLMFLLTKNTSGKDSLLIHVRHINFNESYNRRETGYFYFRAGIYANKNNRYYLLEAIDTVALISKYDATRSLFEKASSIITFFIKSNLDKPIPNITAYSLNEINNIDSIEKAENKLYNAPFLIDGLYLNYKTFKNQSPDNSVAAAIRDGKIAGIKKISNEGKFEYFQPEDVYAVVVNGKPYISIEKEFVPLEKRNDDFYFNATVKVSPNNDATIISSFLFGLVGGIIAASASEGRQATFEMKIDHVSGKFIKVREINNKQK